MVNILRQHLHPHELPPVWPAARPSPGQTQDPGLLVTEARVWDILLQPLVCEARSLIRSSQLPLMLTGYGTYTYLFQTISPTCLANTGRVSCEVYSSLPLTAITYWIMHAFYFALYSTFEFKPVSPTFLFSLRWVNRRPIDTAMLIVQYGGGLWET